MDPTSSSATVVVHAATLSTATAQLAGQRFCFPDPRVLSTTRRHAAAKRMRQNPDAIDHLLARATSARRRNTGRLAQEVFKPVPSEFDTVGTRKKDVENLTDGVAKQRDAFAQVFGLHLVAARR